jgi:hypothetical protein
LIKRVLRLLVVVAVVGLLGLIPVAAQAIADSSVTVEADTTTPEPSSGISRSLPAGPAAPGDEVVVTINSRRVTWWL